MFFERETTMIFAQDQMQNVYVPLPLKAHIIFCIIATIVYALEIYRKRSLHYAFVMAAVDATLLMQAFPNSTMVAVLAVLEVLLLGTAIALSVIESKKKKAEKAAKPALAEGETDEDSNT